VTFFRPPLHHPKRVSIHLPEEPPRYHRGSLQKRSLPSPPFFPTRMRPPLVRELNRVPRSPDQVPFVTTTPGPAGRLRRVFSCRVLRALERDNYAGADTNVPVRVVELLLPCFLPPPCAPSAVYGTEDQCSVELSSFPPMNISCSQRCTSPAPARSDLAGLETAAAGPVLHQHPSARSKHSGFPFCSGDSASPPFQGRLPPGESRPPKGVLIGVFLSACLLPWGSGARAG